MGTSSAKSLSYGEVVMRGSGRVWPLPPPRMVPTLGGGSVMVLEGRGQALLLYVCQRRRLPGHAFILKIIEKQKVKNKYCF